MCLAPTFAVRSPEATETAAGRAPRVSSGSMLRRGFTLIEIMVVVAILSMLSGIAAFGIRNSTRSQRTASFARSLQYLLLQARGEAVGDGFQRKVTCTATQCKLYRAEVVAATGDSPGMALPNAWDDESVVANTGTGVLIYGIDTGPTSFAANASPTALPGSVTVTFFPDGSASSGVSGGTASTPLAIFIEDSNALNRYKLVLFQYSGLTKLMNQW